MKNLLLLLIMISGFAYGQFEVTESSNNWDKIGKTDAAEIIKNGSLMKVRFIDIQSKLKNNDPLSTFKTQSQRNVDKIETAIIKGNEGIKDGFHEFIFNSEPDTIDKIHAIIIDHFANKKKEELTLTFPEGNLYLLFNSATGFYAASIGIDSNNKRVYSAPMLKAQINKLFNKK